MDADDRTTEYKPAPSIDIKGRSGIRTLRAKLSCEKKDGSGSRAGDNFISISELKQYAAVYLLANSDGPEGHFTIRKDQSGTDWNYWTDFPLSHTSWKGFYTDDLRYDQLNGLFPAGVSDELYYNVGVPE
ncbi:hypothetical protein ACTACH_18145 [Pseudomonas syringae]|uniref:hypothetical protein n=1 Tax=Pseudomonas TaxID=286 RepID=UPI0005CB7E72|nr:MULTISPECIES: hypothetical protein [Pseudomonas]ALU60340.1 hypothetical protein ACA40_10885 [Pseudomonas syringae pv. lapsa]MBP1140761.1 hypothetical protein [Pseudomonas sp. PvP009]MCF5649434.1 hypothetical protein [Pseudomonas syringae]MDF5834196.1 hypothetical protein [Pseudomonas syringae]PHN48664.1 hypothetical protein AO254_06895 [Pseudomonas syringae]